MNEPQAKRNWDDRPGYTSAPVRSYSGVSSGNYGRNSNFDAPSSKNYDEPRRGGGNGGGDKWNSGKQTSSGFRNDDSIVANPWNSDEMLRGPKVPRASENWDEDERDTLNRSFGNNSGGGAMRNNSYSSARPTPYGKYIKLKLVALYTMIIVGFLLQ